MGNKQWAEDWDYESGVMREGVTALGEAVIGRRIVNAEKRGYWDAVLTLDDGTEVTVHGDSDCCAYTQVESLKFLADVDNVITRVEVDEEFETWHVYAESVPVVTLDVAWSPGNPYYYGFGFEIRVANKKEDA